MLRSKREKKQPEHVVAIANSHDMKFRVMDVLQQPQRVLACEELP
jgi:hypothetical protein